MNQVNEKFGIATRFYGLSETDVERLATWIDAAISLIRPERIFVAVNVDADIAKSLDFVKRKYPDVNVFPVTPWGKVVQAPNALLLKAAEQKIDYLLFVSTEYPVTEPVVSLLKSHCDEETLVVGAALSGHDVKVQAGQREIIQNSNGLQIPWNTYALWSLDRLIHTGFVLAADSLDDPDNAGMEEMGTIAAQQILWPGKAIAKLVVPQKDHLVFNVNGWNTARQDRYRLNLTSKNARSAAQMKRLSLATPSVVHIGMQKTI